MRVKKGDTWSLDYIAHVHLYYEWTQQLSLLKDQLIAEQVKLRSQIRVQGNIGVIEVILGFIR